MTDNTTILTITTREEFFQAVRTRGLQFERIKDEHCGWCLRDAEGKCPITSLTFAMTGRSWLNSRYQDAAQSIGLDSELASDIMCAADDLEVPHQKLERQELRQLMLDSWLAPKQETA